MASVFISHSSHDKKFVALLAKALNERHVDTWVDDRQIKVGQPIPRRISEGISSSDFFLIVISNAAIQSRWVENELNSAYFQAAQQRTDSILPVLLEPVDLPLLLRALRYADFTGTFERGLHDLLDSLEIDEAGIPFLSPLERRSRITALLSTSDHHGQLPSNVISLVEDESYLDIFESKLSFAVNRRLLNNSLYALLYLAEAWDGRRICRHASIPPLLALYHEAARIGDTAVMARATEIIAGINSRGTYEFLLSCLRTPEPLVVAAILGTWQNMHEWNIERAWRSKFVGVLEALITLPQEKCLYFDHDGLEQDVRFWVFRCLQGLKPKHSLALIEEFLNTPTWAVETLVEAAMAHWCITGTTKYIHVLKRAARRRTDLSNARHFLEEIEKAKRKKRKLTAGATAGNSA